MVFRLQRYAFFLFYKSSEESEEISKINNCVSSYKAKKILVLITLQKYQARQIILKKENTKKKRMIYVFHNKKI